VRLFGQHHEGMANAQILQVFQCDKRRFSDPAGICGLTPARLATST
jgi:hypothetical protein